MMWSILTSHLINTNKFIIWFSVYIFYVWLINFIIKCSKHDCCTNLLIFLLLFLLFQTQAYKCPRAKSPSMNDTIVGHHLTHDETVLLEIINSGKMPIQAFVAFRGKILPFSVKLRTAKFLVSP